MILTRLQILKGPAAEVAEEGAGAEAELTIRARKELLTCCSP